MSRDPWAPALDCPSSPRTRWRRRYLPLLSASALALVSSVFVPTAVGAWNLVVCVVVCLVVGLVRRGERCEELECLCGACLQSLCRSGRFGYPGPSAVADRVAARTAAAGCPAELVGVVVPQPDAPSDEDPPAVWAAWLYDWRGSHGNVLVLPAGSGAQLSAKWPGADVEVAAAPEGSTVELAGKLAENLDGPAAVRAAKVGTL